MRFLVDWLEDAPNRAPEERATAANLEIWLGESNATLHVVGEQLFTRVQMAVYSLAEGLVLDWWRLFGSREEEICLKRYRSGYAVPDIRMQFDGAAFEVHAEQAAYSNPSARFWAGASETLSRDDAERSLQHLINTVLERLRDSHVDDTTASRRWARVRATLCDPEERAFCEAAGALGEDPYAITDAAAATIEQSARIFRDEALTEFLAGARGRDQQRLLAWIQQVRQMPSYTSRLDGLRPIAAEAARTAPARDEPGWSRGYRRARACRVALGLAEADRIKSYKQLATRLGNENFRAKSAVDGIRVLRDDDDQGVKLHLRGSGRGSNPAEQLFSLARGIGDVACFPGPDVAPINDLQHAYRQRCGRAFAAELLAPVREVRAMWDDGRDQATIASEFGVSEMVIEHQLENATRIEQACAV